MIETSGTLYVGDAVEMGLLRHDPLRLTHEQTQLLARYSWLAAGEVQLLLTVFQAGDHGLRGQQARKLEFTCPEGWSRLDACGMLEWQHDGRGRKAYLVLSGKGEDLARALILANHPSNQGAFCPRTDHREE